MCVTDVKCPQWNAERLRDWAYCQISRYPKTSHNMMCTNDKNGKINWFTNVRNLLESCGFEYAFLLDCISFPNAFIKSITQR